MRENEIIAPPAIQDEIAAGLQVLKKNGGYRVTATEDASGELLLDVRFGEYEQTLKLAQDDARKPGAVKQLIIAKLDI